MSMEKDRQRLEFMKTPRRPERRLIFLMSSSHHLSDKYFHCSLLASCTYLESPVESPLLNSITPYWSTLLLSLCGRTNSLKLIASLSFAVQLRFLLLASYRSVLSFTPIPFLPIHSSPSPWGNILFRICLYARFSHSDFAFKWIQEACPEQGFAQTSSFRKIPTAVVFSNELFKSLERQSR